jgi:hypothetical protein
LLRQVLALFEQHPEFERLGLSLGPLAARLSDTPKPHRNLAFILDALYRYHGECHHITVRRWGDKTPLNVFALDRIASVFPNAQYIHLVRDGADVAHSLVEAHLQPDLAAAALRWRLSVNAAQRFSQTGKPSWLEVRYEALVTAPETTVHRVCAFLDIPFDPASIHALGHVANMGDVPTLAHHARVRAHVTADRIGAGRRHLATHECAALEPLIGDSLQRLGYERLAR